MQPRTAWLAGIVFGGLVGLAYLVFPLSVFLGLALWALLLRRGSISMA